MKIQELFSAWEPLSEEFRPGIFWFWNDDLEEEAMLAQIHSFARHQLHEIVLHPIHGLTVEYFSEEYCRKLACAVRACYDAGIRVWIYDEFGWPSGNVGGELLRRFPECGGWNLYFAQDESRSPIAYPVRTERILDNTTGAPWCRRESGYLDTLSAEAVGRFIELTHERVYQALGAELFHAAVLGFFTDEPAMMLESVGRNGVWDAETLPWTPQLPQLFFDRYGFAIEERYAELAAPTDSELRRKYWALATDLHIRNFYQALGDWCRRHQVKFTGHLGDDYPVQQARFAGNFYRALAQMDIPGWDYLGSRELTDERFALQIGSVVSAARAQGKKRVFCEAFGVSACDITPVEIFDKAQLFGIYGVNQLCLMGAHQSFRGIRKHLYWPALFEEAPWFALFDGLLDSIGRSLALSNCGKRANRFAILYPQDHLEQLPVLGYPFHDEKVQHTLAAAIRHIQRLQDGFDFLYAEQLLDPAAVAAYDHVIALSDFTYYPETLKRLAELHLPLISLDAFLARENWGTSAVGRYAALTVPEEVRCFVFEYDADAALIALHNGGSSPCPVTFSPLPGWHAAVVDPVSGTLAEAVAACRICSEATVWLAVSRTPWGEVTGAQCATLQMLDGQVRYGVNTRTLDGVKFALQPEGPWHAGEYRGTAMPDQGLNAIFFQKESAWFEAEFQVETAGVDAGLIFEAGYLDDVSCDGVKLNLEAGTLFPAWDRNACRRIQLPELAVGTHLLRGKMVFDRFESGMKNDGFFLNPPLPSLDLCLAGHFLAGPKGIGAGEIAYALPLNLAECGLAQEAFPVTLQLRVRCLSAGRIALKLLKNTSARLSVGGKMYSVFAGEFCTPECFDKGELELTIELFPTGAAFFGRTPAEWGLASIG